MFKVGDKVLVSGKYECVVMESFSNGRYIANTLDNRECFNCEAHHMKLITTKDLDFNTYQEEAVKSCTYKEAGHYPTYMALASLTEEVGEVAQLLRKSNRDDKPLDLEKLKEELSDVLWSIAMLGKLYNITLQDIAQTNLNKQHARHPKAYI